MVISPGTYLRMRREADGASIEDIASMISTEPKLDERGRAQWLRQIEADAVPISGDVINALRPAFSFDPLILLQLDDIRHGAELPAPRLCRRCACSEKDACIIDVVAEITIPVGGGRPPRTASTDLEETCSWVLWDLCSACPVDEPGEDALPANDEGDNAAEPDHTQGEAA